MGEDPGQYAQSQYTLGANAALTQGHVVNEYDFQIYVSDRHSNLSPTDLQIA